MTTTYLTCAEAAQSLPNRPSASAVWRWSRRGILSRSGVRIRLKHYRLGGKIYTTEADLHRFFSDLAAADASYFDTPEPAPKAKPESRIGPRRHAKQTLREAGIL